MCEEDPGHGVHRQAGPDECAKRAAHREIRTRFIEKHQPARVYVFGPLRGTELIEPRPMNWGTNLTLVGAIRDDRLLTLATSW